MTLRDACASAPPGPPRTCRSGAPAAAEWRELVTLEMRRAVGSPTGAVDGRTDGRPAGDRSATRAGLRPGGPLAALIDYHLGWPVGGGEAAGRPVARRDDVDGSAARRTGLRPAAQSGARQAAGGKQVRPLLLLLVNRALGGDAAPALPVAAAVELLHNASLLLDDVQDRAGMRRGRRAAWRISGWRNAINAGVALQAMAHGAVVRAAEAGLPPERALLVAGELAACTVRLCRGQFADIASGSGARPGLRQYFRICRDKTASLLASAAYLGACLAGRDDLGAPARRLGHHLGICLQVEDDIAGIWGDPAASGKPAGDLADGKRTLPVVHALRQPDRPAELTRLGERFLARERLSGTELERLRELIAEAGGVAFARQVAARHRGLALRAADALGGAADCDLGAGLAVLAAAVASQAVLPAGVA